MSNNEARAATFLRRIRQLPSLGRWLEETKVRLDSLESRLSSVEARLGACEYICDHMRQGCFTPGQARSLLQMRNLHVPASLDETPAADPPAYQSEPVTLEAALEWLREEVPHAFALWREAFDAAKDAYAGFSTDSCSVEGHEMAELFRLYLQPYLRGNVLDIGCGPQSIPRYLQAPSRTCRICGIDPLGDQADHPFEFYRGVAEFLPWEADQFDMVVIGTSIDHVLLLDKCLDEIHRVLRPDGHVALWVSFVTGSEPYDPYTSATSKADEYHLFHCGREWFYEELRQYFEFAEAIEIIAGCHQAFCLLSPKP